MINCMIFTRATCTRESVLPGRKHQTAAKYIIKNRLHTRTAITFYMQYTVGSRSSEFILIHFMNIEMFELNCLKPLSRSSVVPTF